MVELLQVQRHEGSDLGWWFDVQHAAIDDGPLIFTVSKAAGPGDNGGRA